MADLSNPTGHVPSYSNLPTSASDGDVYICDDNSEAFQWGSSTWNFIGNASSGSGQAGSTSTALSTGQVPAASSTGSGPEMSGTSPGAPSSSPDPIHEGQQPSQEPDSSASGVNVTQPSYTPKHDPAPQYKTDLSSPGRATTTENQVKANEAEQPPELSLSSTLLEILDYAFQRSHELSDDIVKVQYANPSTVLVSWPEAHEAVANSQIIIRFEARPTGGAVIGQWASQNTGSTYPPEAPPEGREGEAKRESRFGAVQKPLPGQLPGPVEFPNIQPPNPQGLTYPVQF